MTLQDRYRGCLLGLACGDAVGTTVEFKKRGTFPPVTDMVGGGPFRLLPGQWTDDTSMALCLAASLLEKGTFDARDQMDRYDRWYQEGYLSSNGRCFDIGNTCSSALSRYRQTGDPFAGSTDPFSAGNGSTMRLAPVPMFYYPDMNQAIFMSGESSRTTHGAPECIDACRLLAGILVQAFQGRNRQDVLVAHGIKGMCSPRLQYIAEGGYRNKPESSIRGTGYVVDSLEASLWCFATTDTFEAAILVATNLGDDADTTAAICGQVAGAFYGESGIPERWVQKLAHVDLIRGLADGLMLGGG